MLNLEDSRYTLSTFFEMTPDLVCIAGKDGYFRKINPAVINKLEYTEAELMSQPIFSFMHPDDRDMTTRERTDLLEGKAMLNFQNRYITKTGKIVWLEWTSIYFSEEEVVFAIAKDITKKKLAEQEIEEKYRRFKGLAYHFKTSIEEDRKYLANELHEELAQLATALKVDLDWMNLNLPSPSADLGERMDHALVISESLVNTIRRISFSLSPNMLEDIGLNATLEWLCKEFMILNGVPCYLEIDCDENSLTQEVKIDFFRICQEALSNIMYHAQAGKVTICIKNDDNLVSLTISDDGAGFNIDCPKQLSGITRMRERTTSINGSLVINSSIGKGTTVCVTVEK